MSFSGGIRAFDDAAEPAPFAGMDEADLVAKGGADDLGAFANIPARWASTPAPHSLLYSDAVDRVVVHAMALDLISTVIFQRIYIGVSVTLATHFFVIGLLVYRNRTTFSVMRLALYIAFFGSCALSIMVSGNSFSLGSYFLGLVCYIPFLLVIRSNEATYFEVLKIYQIVALVVGVLVFMQVVVQLVGMQMFNEDMFVPAGLVPPNMNYIQPTAFKGGFMKPNAFFMLEASYTSQFLAVAFIIELAFFKRWARLCVFGFAILATFSGTGLVMILVSLPLLLGRMWRQLVIVAIILLPLLGVVAVSTGWIDYTSNKSQSFDKNGSSANQRFVAPYTNTWDILATGDFHNIMFGLGAGKTSNYEAEPLLGFALWSAAPKVFVEYGLMSALLLIVFTSYLFFSPGVPLIVTINVLLYYFVVGGNFLLPPVLNYCIILCAGWDLQKRKALPKRLAPRDMRPSMA
jgi:hypothetical protein